MMNPSPLRITALSLASLVLLGTGALAQKKAPAKKPAQKPAPTRPAEQRPAVKGTAQLPGDNGKVGLAYTMGPPGGNNINFALESVEYLPARAIIGDTAHTAKADEKLLVIHYTLQNPNKDETTVNWATLKLTAIDSDNVNREYVNQVGKEENKDSLSVQLKPAQKIAAYTVVTGIPAKATVPKLMVQHNDGGGVLRYDLKGLVKGLPAPYADPKDSSGATILKEIPGKVGEYYLSKQFDYKLVSGKFVEGALGEHEPEEDKRFFVATIVIRNATPAVHTVNWASLNARWTMSDGDKVDYNGQMLKAQRNEGVSQELKPGEEVTVRVFTSVPKDIGVKSLTLTEDDEGRAFTFDLSGTK